MRSVFFFSWLSWLPCRGFVSYGSRVITDACRLAVGRWTIGSCHLVPVITRRHQFAFGHRQLVVGYCLIIGGCHLAIGGSSAYRQLLYDYR